MEDWEESVWGDPREVERRKAERKRAAVPRDIRRLQARPLLNYFRGARSPCAHVNTHILDTSAVSQALM